jgi:hypothetical protein
MGAPRSIEGIQQDDEEMKRAEELSLLKIIVEGEDSNELKREELKLISGIPPAS